MKTRQEQSENKYREEVEKEWVIISVNCNRKTKEGETEQSPPGLEGPGIKCLYQKCVTLVGIGSD